MHRMLSWLKNALMPEALFVGSNMARRLGTSYVVITHTAFLTSMAYVGYLAANTGGINSPAMMWMTVLTLPAILLLGRGSAFFWGVMALPQRWHVGPQEASAAALITASWLALSSAWADVEANAPWQHLRRSLLLLLQLLLVVILVLLAARPFVERPAGLARDIVLVVDTGGELLLDEAIDERGSLRQAAAAHRHRLGGVPGGVAGGHRLGTESVAALPHGHHAVRHVLRHPGPRQHSAPAAPRPVGRGGGARLGFPRAGGTGA